MHRQPTRPKYLSSLGHGRGTPRAHRRPTEDTMNRLMLVAVPIALLTGGCVARVVAPAPRVVIEPAAPPPAVVVTPPPQPVYITPQPVIVQPPVLVAPPPVVIVPGTQVYTVPTASY